VALLTFDLIKKGWDRVRKNREEDLLKLAPDMTTMDHVYIKLLHETPTELIIQFAGLESSVNNSSNIPQVKNLIRDWIGRISTSVQIKSSSPSTLVLKISKSSNVLEQRTVKMKTPVIREHKYEQNDLDLGVDRVRIISKF